MEHKRRKTQFRTPSHIELEPYYTRVHWQAEKNKDQDLSKPGAYPFTRGVQETMYRGRLWTMRQYAGFGSAKESNERYHHLFQQGQTGLSVAFDLPTQMGYDSDHSLARGEVGKVGVAISTLEDMEILLKGLPLEQISTSMTINATAPILLGFYLSAAKKQGIEVRRLRGTIQNDLLKEYIARGTYIYPPTPSLRLITDIFDYCHKEVPQWNTISISGYHIREAGSTAVQELAFTFANAMTYVQAAMERGLNVDEFGQRLSFFFNVHNNFFEEIAKFRVARRIWAKIMRENFGAKNDAAMKLRFHSQTAGCSLTAQQPENNIVRVTMQALASVLGGTQSLHTNSMDEALGLPTTKAATIALRTQQVIAHESGVADVIDPLAGSFFLETLTNQMEEKVWQYLDRIKSLGGVIKCIETGWLQKEIQDSAYQYQKAIDSKEEIIVGVNEFVQENLNTPTETLKVSHEIEVDQVQRIQRYKKVRDFSSVAASLSNLKQVAKTSENLVPHIMNSIDHCASLGEISDALREVFGSYT